MLYSPIHLYACIEAQMVEGCVGTSPEEWIMAQSFQCFFKGVSRYKVKA